jgi:hypothetical protein
MKMEANQQHQEGGKPKKEVANMENFNYINRA